ncbi:TPR-like protein [Coprinellus micaceus]|uniref:TPR-like protein n=1 Tax=Coprinellus micaceus TaxID=71717 RepID=A0A4Y7SP72_COPMI|nr:TPR-like protein [Coprinellus micaceus]
MNPNFCRQCVEREPMDLQPTSTNANQGSSWRVCRSIQISAVQWDDYLEDSRGPDDKAIFRWMDTPSPELLLFVYGSAGTGKSTLARHLKQKLRIEDRLAASVFFSVLSTDTWGPDTIIRLIGGEIGRFHCDAIPKVAEAVRRSHGASLQILMETFVRDPLRVLQAQLTQPLIVVLDAVDEWRYHYHFFQELKHLSSLSSIVRFVVFSRSEPRAQHFRELSMQSYQLLPVSVEVIRQYIDNRFNRIKWPGDRKPWEQQVMSLAGMANGLFIWIATACSLLERAGFNPHNTLTNILKRRQNVGESHALARLYYHAIGLVFPDPESKHAVRELLGFMLVLQEPLPLEAFCSLSGVNAYAVTSMMTELKVLQICHPVNSHGTVYPANVLFHASFVEYLGGTSIPPEIGFLVSLPAFHLRLGKACMQTIAQISHSTGDLKKIHLSPKSTYGVTLWPFHVVAGTLPEEPDLKQLEKRVQRQPSRRRSARQTKATTPRRTGHRNEPARRTSMMDLLEGIVTFEQLCWWAPVFLKVLQPECISNTTLGDDIPSLMCSVAAVLNAAVTSAIAFESARAPPIGHPDRSLSLNNLASTLHTNFKRSGFVGDLEEAVMLHRQVLELRPSGHPDRSLSLNNLASTLHTNFKRSGFVGDLEEAVMLHRQVLELRPSGHPDRSLSLNNLADTLQTNFEQSGVAGDLEEAIMLHRQALELRPLCHPDRLLSLNNLASTLQTNFKRSGFVGDLEEAIGLHRQVLELRPSGHPGRSSSLNNLANALQTNFKQSGRSSSSHRAILNRSSSLNNLADTLQTNFEQSGFVGDLEEAIMLHRQALELRPSGHPGRSSSLDNLASALPHQLQTVRVRRRLGGGHHAAPTGARAPPIGHPGRSSSLDNLASALHTNFKRSGFVGDLEEAIMLHRQALELLPSGHPDRLLSLDNLASALHTNFKRSGFVGDLEEAIMLRRQALELLPSGHPDQWLSLNNLASTLHTNFKQSGFVGNLEEAIMLHRQALELLPSGHPDRSSSLNNLADTLQTNFEQSGFVGDLEEAIMLHRQALELLPSGHPDRLLSLDNLASALHTNFKRSGFVGDLEEAIGLHRQALKLRPSGHPGRLSSLNNLASALRGLFKISELARDLDEAIEFSREVLLLRPQGHPKRADTLWNVRLYLYDRFEDQGTVEDLQEAIALSEEALALSQPGSSDHEALLRIIPWYTQELTEATSPVGGLDFNE